MIGDRNKTELTKRVTAAAISYLDERGFKPIETEVSVAHGWVADLAGVVCPTLTELIGLKLLTRKPGYRHPDYVRWCHAATEMQKDMPLLTAIVEVKTSRSDFRGDKKWKLPVPANLAYLAIPDDLNVAEDEFPEGWGILGFRASPDCVRCQRAPVVRKVTTDQQLAVVHEIAVRRDHDTRYERIRELRKEIRDDQNERTSVTRFLTAMRAMRSIVEGEHGDTRTALAYHSVKNIPEYYLKELDKLFGVAAKAKGASA